MLGNVPRGLVIAKLAVVSTQFRGMDTALLKLMPDLRSLKQTTYRMLRKKMQIFEKACQARGQLVVTEAALMMLNSLEGDNWLAMEDVSLDRFDTMKAFDEFYKVFDRDYQYDPEQTVEPHPQNISQLESEMVNLREPCVLNLFVFARLSLCRGNSVPMLLMSF